MSNLALVLLGAGQVLFGTTPTVDDPTLALQRGGFRLPNGIDVALTVQTQTAVDGAVVLRTVFQAETGTPTLTIYAPRPGERVASTTSPSAAGGTATSPVVTYDSRSGIQVIPGSGAMPVTVMTRAAGGGAAALPAGLQQIAGGATDSGMVKVDDAGATRTVTLSGGDLNITHFAGNAFGSAIANAGNDRAIDTQTSVAIDLSNTGPNVLGSSMLRAQDIAATAGSMRGY